MLAGMFIYGGLDSARQPDTKVKAADKVVGDLAGRFDAVETHDLVRVNGIVQVVAGAALALGVLARPAALVLAGSLVPTTLAGHRFWEEDDPAARRQQTIHVLKNAAMMGGLLLAAADTGGRPSLPWRARRAVGHAGAAVREHTPLAA
jgi:uncharacterized membrane protein YphA (DoxX/SURF4 family)